jgi:hypothetical protein
MQQGAKMKRMLLFGILLVAVCAMSGITVFIDTGKELKGDFTEFRDSLAVLNDEGVTLLIPVSRIKVVVDEGKDITNDFLAKAKTGISGDAHFLNESDYFVCVIDPPANSRTEVLLGKMLKPANEQSDMTAEFSLARDYTTIQSQYWFKTRIAKPGDIKTGVSVICFEAINEKGNYRAPGDEKEARSGSWFITSVTNSATRKQGYVTVSGNVRVETANLRIVSE